MAEAGQGAGHGTGHDDKCPSGAALKQTQLSVGTWGAHVRAACELGKWESVLYLLSSEEGEGDELGIVVPNEGSGGEVFGSLHFAARKGKYDVVAALLRRGCDVSVRTLPCGRTSLHIAMDMLNLVAKAKAPPSKVDGVLEKNCHNYITTVKLLLVNGGSNLPGTKDARNKTCWEYCHPETVSCHTSSPPLRAYLPICCDVPSARSRRSTCPGC